MSRIFETMIAIDPSTGLRLREATLEEIAIWEAQPSHPVANGFSRGCFRNAVKVGDMLIDLDTGPGVSHAGAGF